MKSKVKV